MGSSCWRPRRCSPPPSFHHQGADPAGQPQVIVVWQALTVMLFSIAAAIYAWSWPTPLQWALFLLSGVIGSAGHFCLTRAMSLADLSATQPVKFLELLWASVVGFAIGATCPGRRRCWAAPSSSPAPPGRRGARRERGVGWAGSRRRSTLAPFGIAGIAEHGMGNAIQICCGIRSGLNVDPLRVIVRGPNHAPGRSRRPAMRVRHPPPGRSPRSRLATIRSLSCSRPPSIRQAVEPDGQFRRVRVPAGPARLGSGVAIGRASPSTVARRRMPTGRPSRRSARRGPPGAG